RCWPSTTRPTCPRKSPTRWALPTRSTACRPRPTRRRTRPDAGHADAAGTGPGRTGPGAAGRAAAGGAAAGRGAARQGVVDGGRAPCGVRTDAAGTGRLPGADGRVRDAGLLGALRGREFQLAAAPGLPLHRRLG